MVKLPKNAAAAYLFYRRCSGDSQIIPLRRRQRPGHDKQQARRVEERGASGIL